MNVECRPYSFKLPYPFLFSFTVAFHIFWSYLVTFCHICPFVAWHAVVLNRVITLWSARLSNYIYCIWFLKSRCLSCLHRVYSLPQALGYVPPVHHSAVIGLINNLWSVCSQGKEHVKVSAFLRNSVWPEITALLMWICFSVLFSTEN